MKTKQKSYRKEVSAGCEVSWNAEKLLILGLRWCDSALVGKGRTEVLGPSRRALQPPLNWLDNIHGPPLWCLCKACVQGSRNPHSSTEGLFPTATPEILLLHYFPSIAIMEEC